MKALVTGANGHLGNNLCRALLEAGHSVRASIRSLSDPARARSLDDLHGVERVELDVRDAAGFGRACKGIEVLFHVAATYTMYAGGRERADEIVRDSLEGVENALVSAAENGVSKVVLTSSTVTLPVRPAGSPPVTEADWRTDLRVPYLRAKTLAERRAWELAAERKVNLVSILPCAIGGPGFNRRTGTTDVFEGILLGSMRFGAPRGNFPYVDVRDVAAAHLLAAARDVTGRFIVCNDEAPSFVDLTRQLHQVDPKIPVAPRELPDALIPMLPLLDALGARFMGTPRVLTREFVDGLKGKLWLLDNGRAKRELGWAARIPMEQSLREMLDCLKRLRHEERATAASPSERQAPRVSPPG